MNFAPIVSPSPSLFDPTSYGKFIATLLIGLGLAVCNLPAQAPPSWRDSHGQLIPSARGQHPRPREVRLGRLPDIRRLREQPDSRMPLAGVVRPVGAASVRGNWTCEPLSSPPQTLWRIAISTDGAAAVRLRFKGFDLGANMLWVYADNPASARVNGPFTGRGPMVDGEFMTGLIEGNLAVVEYLDRTASSCEIEPKFEVDELTHIWDGPAAPKALGNCQLDATCFGDWAQPASSAGLLYLQRGIAIYTCSGALVKSLVPNADPFFLTANHCVDTEKVARTADIIWNYATASCGGPDPGSPFSTSNQTVGAHILSGAGPLGGDFGLLRLAMKPPASIPAADWIASQIPMTGDTTGIHYPDGAFRRISFGQRIADAAAVVGNDTFPADQYYQIQWSSGRTTSGSSGSPLFRLNASTQKREIVGLLSYGPTIPIGKTACDIDPYVAGYGRFSTIYPQIRGFLESAPAGCAIALSASSASLSPAAGTGSVTVNTSGNCPWAAVSSTPDWLSISGASAGVGTGAVSFAASINVTGATRTGVIVIGDQAFVVTQSGDAPLCEVQVETSGVQINSNYATRTFQITAAANCRWTITNSNPWITTLVRSGTGSYQVPYSVARHTGTSPRTAQLTINQATLNFTQYTSTAGIYGMQLAAGSGTPGFGGDGGAATVADLNQPTGLTVDSHGNLYISDSGNNRVRKVTPLGLITSVAQFDVPRGLAVDSADNLYVVENGAKDIQKVTPGGVISVVPGSTGLVNPWGLAIDASSNLYVTDYDKVYKITPAGQRTVIAGGNGFGSVGDGGPAVNAQLKEAWGVAVDPQGNVYIADGKGSRVRKVGPNGIISTFAGNDTYASSGDGGSAAQAALNVPWAVSVDPSGDIHIAENAGLVVRAVSAESGVIMTTAGGGKYSNVFTTSGLPIATSLFLAHPQGLFAARDGTIYVASTSGNRVWRMIPEIGCDYAIAPPVSPLLSAGLATGTYSIYTGGSCLASHKTTANWIALSGSDLSMGTGPIAYQVQANQASVARSRKIWVAGMPFLVRQDAAQQCSFVAGLNSQVIPSPGSSSQTVNIQVSSGCAWTPTTDETWLHITSLGPGSGSGSFTFSADANPSWQMRSGTIVAGSQLVTVLQPGIPVSLQFNSSLLSALANGGSANVSLSSGLQTLDWVASSDQGWLQITSGNTGTGNGNLGLTVLANNTSQTRTGFVTVGTAAVAVRQPGSNCAYTLDKYQSSFGAGGGSDIANVSTGAAGCTFAVYGAPDWLTASVSGTAVTLASATNGTAQARTATVSIAGKPYLVNQDAQLQVAVTVSTSPAGLQLAVDGQTYASPQTFQWASGSSHTIATTSPQLGADNLPYSFAGWSDGGALSHSVSPSSPITFSASFTAPQPQLSIAKTHSGSFTQGQSNRVYSVTVSNSAAAGPTSGIATVTETIPAGLTLVSMSGTGWSCSSNTCSRSDTLNPGGSYPAITVTVNVSANASSPQVNFVAVSGGGSAPANTTDTTIVASGAKPGFDFNADGKSDILWQNPSTGDLWVWLMNGTALPGAAPIHGVSDWRVPAAADLNGDGKPDILWQHPTSGDLWVWYMNGTVQSGAAPLSGATDWRVVGSGDFNGDGKPDLLWQHPISGDLWVWFMNGSSYSGSAPIGGATTWKVVGTADMNGDGKPDILWQNPVTGDLWVWYMNGTIQTGAAPLGGATTWKVAGTGDFNGDGKPDILWQNPATGDLWTWYMNGPASTGAAPLGGATVWKAIGAR